MEYSLLFDAIPNDSKTNILWDEPILSNIEFTFMENNFKNLFQKIFLIN